MTYSRELAHKIYAHTSCMIHVLHVATGILTPQNTKFIPENMH